MSLQTYTIFVKELLSSADRAIAPLTNAPMNFMFDIFDNKRFAE